MKHYKIAIFFMCIGHLCFAQQMPIDFSSSIDTFTIFGGSSFYRVNDPNDSNNKVGQFVNGGSDPWEGAFIDLSSSINLNSNKIITLRVYASSAATHNVILKLENGANPNVEVLKNISASGWSTLSFDFSKATISGGNVIINATGTYNRLTLFIDGGLTIAGTYLIDDINDGTINNGLDVIYSKLVWSDEFSTNGSFSNLNWFAETKPPDNGNWFNGEVQHYTNRTDNVVISNGSLKIIAKKENYTAYGVQKNYTSARLNSLFSFKYGRVDVMAKLPTGAGTWPAIWMLGTSGGNSYTPSTKSWPYCGEIDIMEHWGNNPNYIHGSLHTPSSYGSTINTKVTLIDNVSTTFHLYSMNWSPNQISFLVDNEIYYTYNPSNKNSDTWPFDAPQFILLNVAMGGVGGTIDSNFTSSAMEIDYVRVYQSVVLNTENQNLKEIKLSPNPVSDYLSIHLKSENIGSKAKLYSILGKELASFIISDINTEFDCSNFASGMYFLKLEGQDSFSQYRFIKK